MRPFLVGGFLLAIAGAAPVQSLAQGLYTDPGRLSALQMQVEQAQRDALASQQAADAAQMRLETEQRVASLNAERAARSGSLRRRKTAGLPRPKSIWARHPERRSSSGPTSCAAAASRTSDFTATWVAITCSATASKSPSLSPNRR